MLIKGIIFEDFVNYKEPSLTIEFPFCSFKCGKSICQNNSLANIPVKNVLYDDLVRYYMENPITKAIVFQGLEPFDSRSAMYELIKTFREYTKDTIVIYTGYTEEEIAEDIEKLKKYKNIIIKFGRFVPDLPSHFDEVLGVNLASSNQYAKQIC